MFKKIMLAVDGPENSGRAIELALRLAAVNRAELNILHVASLGVPMIPPIGFGPPLLLPPVYFEAERERNRRQSRWLARLVEIAEKRGVRATMDIIEASDSIAEEVTRRASEEEVDLVVVGSNEVGGLERLIRGSVSGSVTQKADCPVLVVRGTRAGA